MKKIANHTPGPWVIDPCGDILGNRNTETDNGLICAMCTDRDDGEGTDNARLIAAAPELLEALEELLFCAVHGNGLEAHYKAQAKARAAIAKARGE